MKVFKTIKGETVDVIKHTMELLKEHPDMQIHMGTDSQNHKRKTTYVTVIAYRYGTRGVHYIYSKKKVPRIQDMWTRLWKETEDTLEVAEWFTSKLSLKVEIDMDYNEDEYHKSNMLIAAAKGWATGLGYKVNCKPIGQVSTKAADYHCRS